MNAFAGPDGGPEQPPAAGRPVRLLVVDDNAGKRLALRAVLEPLGYPVVEAESGLAALRFLKVEDFAVVLLDVRMPGMDGFETAALIRLRRQSETTPIIFISSSAPDELLTVDRYAGGAVDFMFAPVNAHELRAKVSVFAKLFLKADALVIRAREVQAYADRLRLLTDAAPTGIFQTDARNRYTYTNPCWTEITGISAEDAVGRDWDSILDDEQRAELHSALDDGAVFRSDLSRRFTLRREEAADRVVMATSKSMLDRDGRLGGFVGTLADVTAEVGAEAAMAAARDEATAASRLKSDFLANVSHEIRTPMNGVIGMTDLLMETDLDAHQRDYAQTVRNSGEALMTIINDILDFSKVEAGKLDIEAVKMDVRAVVGDAVHLLASPAQTKGIELVLAVDRDVPAVVTGDPGRVRQVLTNLIGNAIKFTHAGTIAVRVSLASVARGTSATLHFEVVDTGVGIPQDKLTVIFQPFVQADSSTSRRYGGTGLGLAIISELVALMGGRCGATSLLGQGSTFWFTVVVEAQADQTVPEILAPDADLTGVRVLVVDDSPVQREVLTEHLTCWGMTVTTAGSGTDVLAALRAGVAEGLPVAIALVDHGMPGLDTAGLTAAVAAEPALGTRLVLMTQLGHGPDGEAAEGDRLWLAKPLHLAELRARLREAAGAAPAEHAPPGDAPAREGVPIVSRGMGRLLLAEDNLINQKVALAMLTNAGYEVDAVPNGAEAVRAVSEQVYDAVLMDCQMPEMNGYEATAAIRRLEGPGRRIPIIAMTAGARREDRERCLAAGMDSYLSKPVSKQLLISVVTRSVRDRGEGAVRRVDRRSGGVTLDTELLDELRGAGSPEDVAFVVQLVEQFVADAEQSLLELRAALRLGDDSGVARLVHSLKGSSGQLGGRRLAASCARLERLAAEHGLVDGPAELDELEADFQDLRRTLTERLAPV